MKFIVTTADRTTTHYEAKYELEDGGVLKITEEAPSKTIKRLSPMFWQEIRESDIEWDLGTRR